MIRRTGKESLQLVHPLTGKVLLSIDCDSRHEATTIQKDVESALACCCEMYRYKLKAGHAPQFIVAGILRACELVKEDHGFGMDLNRVNLKHKEVYGDQTETQILLWEEARYPGGLPTESAGINLDGGSVGQANSGGPDAAGSSA